MNSTDPQIEYHRDEYRDQLWNIDIADETLNSINNAIEKKEIPGLRASFNDLFELGYEIKAGFENYYDDIDEYLTIMEIEEGDLIYVPRTTKIEVPKLIISISADFLKLLAKNPQLLYSIPPRKFEEIIAEIFFRKGFEIELTKSTRDGGKDIIAIYNHMNIRTKYIIECKRYSRQNKISIGIVQRLLGVKISASANKAILATTSTFTKDAREFSKNHIWDLDLKDYNDIVSWVKAASK